LLPNKKHFETKKNKKQKKSCLTEFFPEKVLFLSEKIFDGVGLAKVLAYCHLI